MKKIGLCFWFLIYSNQLFPQSDPIQNTCCTKINGAYFKSYLTDTRDIFVSPFHWDKKEWLLAGSVITADAVLLWQDENIQSFSQTIQNENVSNFNKYVITNFGTYYPAILFSGFGIYGLAAHDKKSCNVALTGAKAMVLTGAFTAGAKFIFQRHRPYEDEPPNAFDWEFFTHGLSGHYSYFSGHTSIAFASAVVFAEAYKDKKAVPIIAYSIASLVGLSRIYDNKHWASDVLMGAAIGFGIGKLVTRKSLTKKRIRFE